MILAASCEFDTNQNAEVTVRPTDNEEVPQVCFLWFPTDIGVWILQSLKILASSPFKMTYGRTESSYLFFNHIEKITFVQYV